MGRIKVKQDSITKNKDINDNSLYEFYDGEKLVAKLNIFPSGDVFVWKANKIFTDDQEIDTHNINKG